MNDYADIGEIHLRARSPACRARAGCGHFRGGPTLQTAALIRYSRGPIRIWHLLRPSFSTRVLCRPQGGASVEATAL